MQLLRDIPFDQPILIAGPTASGKSALALAIATQSGGQIINADALQVFGNWRVLTARPSLEEEARAKHALYGHISGEAEYSVGHWLRDIAPLLKNGLRPIIVGGTGLYFSALTEGLADIPPTPSHIREKANVLIARTGLQALIDELDPETAERIDLANPMRVQRAWEVQKSTGRALADWQDATPPALLSLSKARAFLIDASKEWLTPRIEKRFDLMVANGALEEAEENLISWNPSNLSSKAIGAPELIAYLKNEMTLEEARNLAIVGTRQYAKRQRSWFRARMKAWQILPAPELAML